MFTTALIEKGLKQIGVEKELQPGIISNVSIDSRSCSNNSFFFAFKGENVDGHDFIPALLEKGVLCAGEKDLPDNDLYIKVPDVLEFLSVLAKERRKLFKGKVFAITGSSGKTSTRQLVVSILQLLSKNVHATSGNLNNHIGMPLVILNTPINVDSLVLEMGMNHAGEIARLTEIADPDLSVITNIGTAHIGNFKSQDELALAKLEIFQYSKGVIVADTGNDFIRKWVGSNRSERKIVEYSSADSENIAPEFDYLEKYMIENLYTASVMVKASEGVIPDLGKVVKNARFPSMRGEIRKVGNRTFVVDCYNANPGSMKSSIENFYEKYSRKSSSETYLILGSMFELGEFSKKMHEELVNYLKNLNLLKRVFLIGCEFEKIRPGFLNEKKVLFLGDIEDVVQYIPKEGIFLLKGSRGNRMEKIFDLFEKIGGVD